MQYNEQRHKPAKNDPNVCLDLMNHYFTMEGSAKSKQTKAVFA